MLINAIGAGIVGWVGAIAVCSWWDEIFGGKLSNSQMIFSFLFGLGVFLMMV